MLSGLPTGFVNARSLFLASVDVPSSKLFGDQNSFFREGTGFLRHRCCFTVPMARQTFTVFSHPLLPAMTYPASLVVIPLLAIAYLLLVYGMLVLAQRLSARRRSQG